LCKNFIISECLHDSSTYLTALAWNSLSTRYPSPPITAIPAVVLRRRDRVRVGLDAENKALLVNFMLPLNCVAALQLSHGYTMSLDVADKGDVYWTPTDVAGQRLSGRSRDLDTLRL
jgi:hypothetical protein